MPKPTLRGLQMRIRSLTDEYTYAEIGDMTGVSGETARRYLNGSEPSVRFIMALCRKFRVSADWLLFGKK